MPIYFHISHYNSIIVGEGKDLTRFVTVAAVICIVSDVLLFWIVTELVKKDRLEKHYAMLQEQSKMEQSHLNEMQFVGSEYKQKGQVIGAQLTVVKDLLEVQNYEKGQQAFQKLINNEIHLEQKTYCANPVINAVLKYKAAYAQSMGISIQTDILVSTELNVDDISLCNLFANLLDNAIEACSQIEQEDKRWITCNVSITKGVMAIKVENACLPQGQEKKIIRNKQIQGYGRKILHGIVEEYKGHIKYMQVGKQFTATVFLPLQMDNRKAV